MNPSCVSGRWIRFAYPADESVLRILQIDPSCVPRREKIGLLEYSTENAGAVVPENRLLLRRKSMSDIFDYLDWRGDIPFSADPFNEVDALVLAELSYVDFSEIVPGAMDLNMREPDADELKNCGRFARGVIAMRLHDGDKVTSICKANSGKKQPKNSSND